MEIIRNAVRQMGEKIDVEREITTLVSGKKLELKIMTMIPLGMVLYMKISFPEFLDVLYGNLAGVIIMSICLLVCHPPWYCTPASICTVPSLPR